jgi:hypothetical protein
MVYFVFDLDQTLVDIGDQLFTKLYRLQKLNSNELYQSFVYECADQETGSNPIGFLRPGLVRSPFLPEGFIPYMDQILALYQKGICQGVILYSNNGFLPCLTFIKDLIHTILNIDTPLICQCIHRSYPGRPKSDDPSKTWEELHRLVTNPNDPENTCTIHNFELSNVIMFDDRPDHIIRHELGANYIHVAPYTIKSNREQYLEKDVATIQSALNRYDSSSLFIQFGGSFNYTRKNWLKQKKEQRKRKYRKKSNKKKKKAKNRI